MYITAVLSSAVGLHYYIHWLHYTVMQALRYTFLNIFLHCTLYNLKYTIYTVHSLCYTIHSTLCTLHYTLYSALFYKAAWIPELQCLFSFPLYLCPLPIYRTNNSPCMHSTLYTLHWKYQTRVSKEPALKKHYKT